MPALVNVFHPSLATSRVVGAWTRALAEAGLKGRDLYGLYPDGKLDVELERRLCEAADAIVFVHPLHWYSAPWLMKRWIDEVLAFGWAYGGPDRLRGKAWLSVVSVGAGEEEYRPDGSRRYSVAEFLRPYERTAAFCAMAWREPFVEYGGGFADAVAIEASSDRVRATVLDLQAPAD